MIEPLSLLCDQHLLGEHGELHKFLPTWAKRHGIAGRVAGNQIEPASYAARHDALASEMSRRGMNHASPLEQPDFSYLPPEHRNATVDQGAARADLIARCPACAERLGKDPQ